MAENTQEQKKIQIHVDPALDYKYRDVINIFIGNGDVTFEFGNHHRSMPGHVTISDRIVVSMATAYEFVNRLQQSLVEVQKQLQKNLQDQTK